MKIIGCLLSTFTPYLYLKEYTELRIKLMELMLKLNILIELRIPNKLVDTLVVAEDTRFDNHRGVDVFSICRVIWNYLLYRKKGGASTIEQQLVRTVLKNYEHTLARKIKEIFLAVTIETYIKKEQIPKLYLAVAYMGWKMNGVEQACKRLGFDLESLNVEQAAEIVSRLKYPQPKKNILKLFEKIERRRNYILKKMNNGVGSNLNYERI